MNIKEKWQAKIKEFRYLNALREKGKVYMKYLEAVNEIQSFNENACFEGYPEISPLCSHFKEGCSCERKTCPLYQLNGMYITARKEFEEARQKVYQAETAMICGKVKE